MPEDVADLAAVHVSLTHLHPVTQAAALFCGWRLLGPTGPGPAVFVQQAISGLIRLKAGGTVPYRLAKWLAGAERATL